MLCIYCSGTTDVINSRHQKRINNIWRRRQCAQCMAVFTTSESTDLFKSLSVVHKNDLRPFSRDKLFLSVYDSLKHRITATDDATSLTNTIISHLYPLIRNGGINREDIIRISAQILKRFDKAAASHYLAYHP